MMGKTIGRIVGGVLLALGANMVAANGTDDPPGTLVTVFPFSDPGNTVGFNNTYTNYSSTPCLANLNFPYPGPDAFYRVPMVVGGTYNISASLTGSTGDLALFLLSNSADAASCVNTSNDAIGAGAGPETIPAFTPAVSQDFFVVVDSYYAAPAPASAGTFTLSVTCTGVCTLGGAAPTFAYTPAASSTVAFTGGSAVGSTANASIAVAVATPGTGTGAASTTTTTCTAPTAPFAGFGQTVTAEGAGAISGGPLAGACTVGAALATQTLTCNENRGGTPTAITFTLSCPAGTASADLGVTKTDGVTAVAAGGSTTYTIVASNAGPDAATGATVADTFPATCTTVNWTCISAGGGTCTASGTGNINDTVNLPSGSSATYTAVCAISAAASGTLVNTATVTAPAGVTDPTPGNNSATDTDTIATNAAPIFSYTPAAAGTVTFTGGGAVGSTGTGTISVAVGTAGVGTGAASTTTTTCTAPTVPFTGFGQTVTAEGAGAISGSPLTGTCTLGVAAATQTLTCSENRGGTPTAVTFTLDCPAGTALPLTSTPVSGSTVTIPQQTLGNAPTSSAIAFQNPGAAAVTVTCTAPVTPEFSVAPLSFSVPATGNASTTVSFNSAVAGNFTGVLNCTAGAQAFTFNLAGSAGFAAQGIPAMGDGMRQLLMLAMLAIGLLAMGLYNRRS